MQKKSHLNANINEITTCEIENNKNFSHILKMHDFCYDINKARIIKIFKI